jgi:mRNA interferase MazF
MSSVTERGEIWEVSAGADVIQHDDAVVGNRRVVVLSPPELNQHLQTVLVAPLSTADEVAPFRVAMTHAGHRCVLMLDQITVVQNKSLQRRMGTASAKAMDAALAVLGEMFAA